MLKAIAQLDQQILLYLNGIHSPVFDQIMWLVSAPWTWLPLYGLVFALIAKKFGRSSLVLLILLAILITVSDQLSGLFKTFFQRARPSHDPNLSNLIHITNGYRGGDYGFISAHAANTFAFATFISLLMKRRAITLALFIWAGLVSYSRIYLGVHYPGDIAGGMALGFSAGYIAQRIWLKIQGGQG